MTGQIEREEGSWDERERRLKERLAKGGRKALDAARTAVSDPDWPVRDTAVEALEYIGTARDVPLLARVLSGDQQWEVRASAAASLGRFREPAGRRALRAALEDPSADVRRYAAVSLARYGDPAAIPWLEARLSRETDDRARTGLLGGLYSLGRRVYLSPLLALLDSPDYVVRCQVVGTVEALRAEVDEAAISGVLRARLAVEEHPAVRDLLTHAFPGGQLP